MIFAEYVSRLSWMLLIFMMPSQYNLDIQDYHFYHRDKNCIITRLVAKRKLTLKHWWYGHVGGRIQYVRTAVREDTGVEEIKNC